MRTARGWELKALIRAWALGSVALAGVLWTPQVSALDPGIALTQYRHQAWDTGDGLPQSSVLAIAQTPDGYLWLGTEEGLVRFDGVSFTVFDSSSPNGPRHNVITALLADRQGVLWIGTRGGGLARLENGAFTTFDVGSGLSDNEVRCLAQGADGSVLVGTNSGVDRFDNGQPVKDPVIRALPRCSAAAVLQADDGTTWVAAYGVGIIRVTASGTSTTLTTRDGLADNRVLALCLDRDGSVWIATYGGGLSRYANGAFRTFGARDGVHPLLYAVYEDRRGTLWVGTRGAGLLRRAGDRFEPFTTADGLSNDTVGAFLEDREGTLWIGTDNGGLNRLADGKVVTYTRREGLPHDVLRVIMQGRGGTVWIGTEGGGLAALTRASWRTFTTRDGLASDFVSSLAEDRSGDLWVGTSGHGLSRLHAGSFTTYRTKNGLPNDYVAALLPLPDGAVFAGTRGGGLARIDGARITTYTTADGLADNTVDVLAAGRDGRMWIGTRAGLCALSGGVFTTWRRPQGLASEVITCLYEDVEGVLWIGAYGTGLIRFKGGKFVACTAADGLIDDTIFQILEDDLGNLWGSCNRGIFRVSKRELDGFAEGRLARVNVDAFGTADGMKSRECNGGSHPAGWKTRDGRLWFPTLKGATVVEPWHVTINSQMPPVHIERALVDRERLELTAGLRIPPGKTNFELHYTALSLAAPEKVKFRYRLEGYDQQWVEAGGRRIAYYTRIPPGRYTFRVTACNNDGVWNYVGASWTFEVRPFFRQTVLFYALCVLAAVLLAWGVLRMRLMQLEARNAVLAERNRISREIHDTLAQGLTAIVLQLEAAQGTLATGPATANVLRAHQLARDGLKEAERAVQALRPSALEHSTLAGAVRRVVESVTGGTEVLATVQESGTPRRLPSAREEEVFHIVQEAATNALRHSGCHAVRVDFEWRRWRLTVDVADDGHGFDVPSDVARAGTPGLRGMAERAAAVGARLTIESTPGRGTVVTVELPLRPWHFRIRT